MESSLWIVLNILKGLAAPKQFTVKSPTFLKVKYKMIIFVSRCLCALSNLLSVSANAPS